MQTFIDIRRSLHQIPELGFAEFKTQQYLLKYLAQLPSDLIQIQTWATGILAHIPGKQPSRCIGYRTDMDGLPITEATTYSFQSKHSGNMHACGHDLHMAIALGVLTHFVENPIDDDLLFIFQPAEEGPGGALPMLQSKKFQAWKPDVIFALHIAPDYPVGTVATKPGILFANTQEVDLELVGTSGHAAYPHRANDMVIAASQLALQLQTVVSRNIDPLDSVIVTLGKMAIGTKENIIAGQGMINGTIRTLSDETMNKVKNRIQQIADGIATGFQCEAHVNWGMNYLQVNNHDEITQNFMEWVDQHSPYHIVECREAMTGEDFGYFLQDIPGMMFWLGVDSPYGLHHPQIEPSEEAIPVAIDLLSRFINHQSQQKPSVATSASAAMT